MAYRLDPSRRWIVDADMLPFWRAASEALYQRELFAVYGLTRGLPLPLP